MKNLLLFCLTILFFQNCQPKQQEVVKIEKTNLNEIKVNTPTENTIEIEEIPIENIVDDSFNLNQHLKNYSFLKSRIKRSKQRIRNNDLDSIQKIKTAKVYFSNILIDSVFQYWIGTAWDFNGYTNEPRKGLVACGYFVSTTLKHIGVPINRYKVAQKAASDIVKELCHTPTIHTSNTLSKLESYLKTQANNEIFILGLSNHVGFVFKRNGKNYFAHSNYIDNAGVMIERFEESEALKMSTIYMIGNVSKNEQLIDQWLNS